MATQPITGLFQSLSSDIAAVVERAGQAVVRVDARPRFAASGIVWTADGLILTADHVVQREENIMVALADGRELEARLAGRDPGTDLALLRVDATGLPAAEFGQAQDLGVGQLVLALGRPRTDGIQATIGVVSALGGPWQTWRGGRVEGFIQTDVTMYPGFSGGPLVNAAGQVVGLNSSALARGISLAIPAETLGRVGEALKTRGRVRRGYLGVGVQPVPLPASLTGKLGLAQETGLLVLNVEPGGPAERGGLILGDIIVGLAGQVVRDMEDLQRGLAGDVVGTETAVKVVRGGELRDLTMTVGERE